MKMRIRCLLCGRYFWAKVYPIEIHLEHNKKEVFVFLRNLKSNEEVPYFKLKRFLNREAGEIIDNSIEIMKQEKMDIAKIEIPLSALCLRCRNRLRMQKNFIKKNPKKIKIVSDKSNPKFWI